jgi:hypothetical protein
MNPTAIVYQLRCTAARRTSVKNKWRELDLMRRLARLQKEVA